MLRQRTADPFLGWEERGGLLVPGGYKRPKSHPIAIDLFCGCGGFTLGIMQAGFRVIAGLDNDPASMHTYLHNLGSYPVNIHFADDEDRQRAEAYFEKAAKRNGGRVLMTDLSGGNWRDWSNGKGVPPVEHFFFGDIRKFTGQQILDAIGMERGDVDLVVGGPPCQGFSYAGKRNVMDPRNSLVFEWARMVLEIWPKTMCMENVPGIVNMVIPEGIPVLDALCHVLEEGSFGTFDALKSSLLGTSGVGTIIRGRPKRKGETAAEDESEDDPSAEQLEMEFAA